MTTLSARMMALWPFDGPAAASSPRAATAKGPAASDAPADTHAAARTPARRRLISPARAEAGGDIVCYLDMELDRAVQNGLDARAQLSGHWAEVRADLAAVVTALGSTADACRHVASRACGHARNVVPPLAWAALGAAVGLAAPLARAGGYTFGVMIGQHGLYSLTEQLGNWTCWLRELQGATPTGPNSGD